MILDSIRQIGQFTNFAVQTMWLGGRVSGISDTLSQPSRLERCDKGFSGAPRRGRLREQCSPQAELMDQKLCYVDYAPCFLQGPLPLKRGELLVNEHAAQCGVQVPKP